MAEISIIIPVYNAERYIHRCLESVLRQSFQDYQVIIVNDGSVDNSLALCRQYSEQDSRFLVLDKENGGAASARNLALNWVYRIHPSKWICFLDIDDFIHEDYLTLLHQAALERQVKISMCSFSSTTEDVLPHVNIHCNAVSIDTETIWCERQINCTIPWAKLFSADIFESIRFPEGIIHEDEFTLYRALFQCKTVAFLDLPLYGYYQTETSVMRGAWTPRHMTEPDGLFAQLSFFEHNDYQHAAAYTARIFLLSLYNNLCRCKTAGDQYNEYAKVLKKRLQTELGNYQKLAGLSIESEPWLFYEAYPIRTIPHRVLKKMIKK